MILMMGQRAAASAAAHLRGARRAARRRRPPRRRRPRRVPAATSQLRRRRLRLRANGTAGARRHFDAAPAPGRDGRARRPHRQRQVHRGPPAAALLRRRPAARCASTATTCATSRCRACATTSAWCSTSRSSSRCRSATTSPTAGPTRPIDEVVGRGRGGRRRRLHPRAARRLRHGRRRARLHAVGRPAPAHRDRPHPARRTRRSSCSTTPRQRHRRAGRAADPRRAARRSCTDRTTLIIAHRLSTISLADRVVVSRAAGSSPRAPTPTAGHRAPLRRDPRPAPTSPRRRRRRAEPSDEDDLRYRLRIAASVRGSDRAPGRGPLGGIGGGGISPSAGRSL